VRFADVDLETLGRFASDVEAAATTMLAAQATLDAARDALQEKQEKLMQHAQRALAYARVYAENDATLSAQLELVTLPRAARRARGDEALVLSIDPQPAPRPPRERRTRKAATSDATTREPTLEAMAASAE
jgi:hypothetical protein